MGKGNITRGVAGAAAGGLLAHQLQKEKEVSTPWERFALGGGIATFGFLSGILGSMIGYPVELWSFGGIVMIVGLYICFAAWGFTPLAIFYMFKGVPVRVARLTSGIPWKNICEDGRVFAVGRRRKHVYPHVKKRSLVPGGFAFQIVTRHGGLTPDQIGNLDKSLGVGFRLPVEISQVAPHVVQARVAWKDPLQGIAPLTVPMKSDASYRVPIGLDVVGEQVFLDPSGVAGALVSGIPGSGKTVLGQAALASLALAGADIYGSDFKGSGDWDAFSTDARPVIKNDLAATGEMVAEVRAVMEDRLSNMRPLYGQSNFWNIDADVRPPLVVLFIDEIQEMFPSRGMSKEDKEIAEKASADVISIMKRGRSAGVFQLPITQKPASDSIPTNYRDVIELRFTGRQLNRHSSEAAIGFLPEEGLLPHELPGIPGRMLQATQSDGLKEFQAYYLPEQDLWNSLEDWRNQS